MTQFSKPGSEVGKGIKGGDVLASRCSDVPSQSLHHQLKPFLYISANPET